MPKTFVLSMMNKNTWPVLNGNCKHLLIKTHHIFVLFACDSVSTYFYTEVLLYKQSNFQMFFLTFIRDMFPPIKLAK